jgi:glutamate synthase (ferredoxin)
MSASRQQPSVSGMEMEPTWLVDERDACGVGFLADLKGTPTHSLVVKALKALDCMEHRGGCSADADSGDGAGLMTEIPWRLLDVWMTERQLQVPMGSVPALGMFFLPQTPSAAAQVRSLCERLAHEEGLQVIAWRDVPVHPEVLGPQAAANQPLIQQFLVASPDTRGDHLERKLYRLRKRIEKASQGDLGQATDSFYVCSFSSRTVVYKGMVRSAVLSEFYEDLRNPRFESVFAIYHRRFSTNTMPRWPLAQPMRLLGHNGEINTLLGNVNWMKARTPELASPVWGQQIEDLEPFVDLHASDSANLDSSLELLVQSGRSPQEALMILVPEAYLNQPALADYPDIVNFYEFYSGLQEPWDGPALLVFGDGKVVGATLDRNGLRPARYCITRDGLVIVGSEAGVVPVRPEEVVEKGRLGPGQMIEVDLERREVLKNWDLKQRVARQHPYGSWLQNQRQRLEPQPFTEQVTLESLQLLQQQTAFGYTAEDVEMVIESMAGEGKEPTFCMGDDIPLAILSSRPHVLYDYFKQRFAQVTNPAIDPLRESLVMSLSLQLGKRGNLLEVGGESSRLLKLDSPVLNEAELVQVTTAGPSSTTLSTLYPITSGPNGLRQAVDSLCRQAATAVRQGKEILILSDRPQDSGLANCLTPQLAYIPPLLAVGSVHHALIREGLRMQASLVVDTAQCWSTHHFACLIGYGASAVCPYLALETVRHWWHAPKTRSLMERNKLPQISLAQAQKNFRQAVEAGLLKILSKMGISLLASYQGAQIFEAIGLSGELIALGFCGTTSRLGGLSMADLANETMVFHRRAFPELNQKKLENFGFVQYRPGGEYHMNSPEMSKALHKAVEAGKDYDHYEFYRKFLEERPITALRDLLDFQSDRPAIDLDQVESVESIVQRFCTGGMSLGALSREAHETLAIAMNRLGGKSNSGEGGEDPIRYTVLNDVDAEGNSPSLPHLKGLRNGDRASSAIKQIASGRFGVTPEYLINAEQLEIKVAQGAKPGEGGQLPGKKVSPYIAYLRNSKPGVALISPPPHHDIYSIEDLAQLIYDLHQINPQAKVSVKLVSEVGIGTIAAGVAKANADVIQISGHDGGTGASPLSSIKHAGSPWELGLTEVHRVLMNNQLRGRVLLRVDGGFKTGWDVVMGALMGGEEFGFGSIAMIAEGCIMARVCHTNNCPVGVATQQAQLRKRFTGIPEHVVNFFWFVAEEVRHLLAHLGYQRLEEIIGRADLLTLRAEATLAKTQQLDLRCLTELPDTRGDRSWLSHGEVHDNGHVLDDELLADPEIQGAIAQQGSISKVIHLLNTDRSVGSRLAGVIAKRYGNKNFEGQITLNFSGSAGQSLGAFNIQGVSLRLEGEANDYVGKGMNGGEIVIKPSMGSTFDPGNNVIIGNTCLYGATGGRLFASGRAGERFAVRNSAALAVVEGTGDHCCEYMTGGVVVVLGATGRNVGAGMTGGLAYILDEQGLFPSLVNLETVQLQRVCTVAGERQLRGLLEAHAEKTGSLKAQEILSAWDDYLPRFWQLVPPSEAKSPEASPAPEEQPLAAV